MSGLPWPAILGGLVLGYLSGSIPFGLLLTRMAGLGDIRSIGSGNIGATNVLRTGNKGLAAATLLLDALKGLVPLLLVRHFLGQDAALAAAIGAFLGHCFPVWLGFKGGKGLATFLGCALALDWRAFLVFGVVWLSVAAIFRFSSLAGLAASLLSAFVPWWFGDSATSAALLVLTAISWFKHRANIERLLAGTESKIGAKGVSGLRLSDEQRLDWLRLIRSERVGPRTFRSLINRFGGAREALEALPDLARKAGRGRIAICSREDALREMERADALGIRFVASGDASYPVPLGATDDAPPLIAVRGDAAVLTRPMVAIVGSRNASASGGVFAERLAAGLGEAGFVVVSGLARGIDTRAHRASVPTGTVAVLAGGHERIYPSENVPLLDRIVGEGGAAISEMPIAWEPRGRDFPRRNRIVSGMSYGVVVVEAARRSGSLITARFAAEQGREVFAVPGSPLDPRAEGTNDLIRGGATLCSSVEHVVAALSPLVGRDGFPDAPGAWREAEDGLFGQREEVLWDELDLDGIEATRALVADEPADIRPSDPQPRIEDLLSANPVGIDDLARQAGLPVQAIQTALVELELAGRLARHGGGLVSLQPRTERAV